MTGWRKWVVYLGYFLASLVILAAFLVSVTRFISPFLDQDRGRFEQYLQVIFQHPVSVGHVNLTWNFLKPTLNFSEVKWIDSETRQSILTIHELDIAPAIIQSLRAWTILPSHVQMSGVNLSMVEQKNGQWELNGLQFNLPASATSTGWRFAHPDFLLKDIQIKIVPLTSDPYFIYLGLVNLNTFWDGQQGDIYLSSKNVLLHAEPIFHEPLFLSTIQAESEIVKTPQGNIIFNVKKWQFANSDVSGQGRLGVNWFSDQSPDIQLTGQFAVYRAENIVNYLPNKIFSPELNQWLHAAFLSGSVDHGHIVLRGKLNDFPFDQNSGEFTIGGDVHHANLHFASAWPNAEDLNGKLIFSGRSMHTDIQSGYLSGAKIQSVEAIIPKIAGNQTELQINGMLHGELSDGIFFVKQSPLKNRLLPYFSLLNPNGEVQLNLKMSIPLNKPKQLQLTGKLNLINDTLRLSRWPLLFNQLNGELNFSEKGIESAHALALNSDKSISLTITKSKPDQAPTGFIEGELSTLNLQTWLGASLQKYIQGSTLYTATFVLPKNASDFSMDFHSDLIGMQINLLNLYQKNKIDPVKMNLHLAISPTGEATHISFVNPNTNGLFGGDTEASVEALPNGMMLSLENKQLKGKMNFLFKKLITTIDAKFDYLHLMKKENASFPLDPRTLPALTLSVNQLWYNTIALGRVDFISYPKIFGMQIQQLNITSPIFQLRSNGDWMVNQSHLQGELTTQHTDQLLNTFVEPIANFQADDGALQFNLSWPGAPWQFVLDHLTGNMNLHIKNGRIINLSSKTNTQVGLGRVLNLLSLQSIPRRLSLNFSDLFDKGYNFDSAKGDFIFQGGNALTHDTRLNGTVAHIDVRGRIGLVKKDYDLHLDVTPHVTSSLPVVAAIATANPLAGLVTWIVEKAMSRQVSKLVTYHYFIVGPWDNPSWQKTDN